MSSCDLQILTPSGNYESFFGVRASHHTKCVKLKFDSGDVVRTTLLHKFIDGGVVKFAKDLKPGESLTLGENEVLVISMEIQDCDENFYDPVNVANGSVFCHDSGLISHNTFLGSTNNLLSSEALLGLKARDPIEYHNDVKFYEGPKEECNYVAMIDVSRGRGQDYSTITVINVSVKPFLQVATFRNNLISPLVLPDVAVRIARIYNEAVILIESNDAGQVVCNAIYHEYEYENVFVESSVKAGGIGVTMNKRVKREGCSNLKDLIETGNLEVVDADAIEELSSFEADGTSYSAAQGCHDDMVMNLVLFAWFVSSSAFKNISNIDLRNMMFAERLREMEEDVPFVGYFPKEEDVLPPEYAELLRQKREWSIL